jgi:nucleoside-diphosphate-sugar epimerase
MHFHVTGGTGFIGTALIEALQDKGACGDGADPAGVARSERRERLCRYISRPAVAVPRLSLSSAGKVVYTLNTPYRDGTTQVAFDRGGHPPVDFIARLAALVPKPRVNLTRQAYEKRG